MFYFLLALTINLILLYSMYQKLIIRINEPDKKEKAEINSLMVEFNRVTKNNIDLLEDKVQEIKNLLRLVDGKIAELKKGNAPSEVIKDGLKTMPPPPPRTKANKVEVISRYYEEGRSVREIAGILGITDSEVELYLNFKKKK
ncbi:MAG: hypothetical protein PHF84_11120 [bacterium]|nr:hypothetical protein [bacterium]